LKLRWACRSRGPGRGDPSPATARTGAAPTRPGRRR
jgi:hypothetical protein